jgi:hypothetical protein
VTARRTRALTPTAVWSVSPALVRALDERLGVPVDHYVNGTQTWLTDGPGDELLEWRLHPVAGYRTPTDLSHYDVWEQVTDELARDVDPEALALGAETRALGSLWDGLECYPPHTGELEPAVLGAAAAERLGVAPDGIGLVDHERIGQAWERAGGRSSILALLLEELGETGAGGAR